MKKSFQALSERVDSLALKTVILDGTRSCGTRSPGCCKLVIRQGYGRHHPKPAQPGQGFAAMRRILKNILKRIGLKNILEAVKAGVNSYIVKPFTAETVDEKLKKIIAAS